jgi:putative PIN family toxin of toxin-antitoxin system
MRLVLDTNIVISGLFWGGNPAGLLDAAQLGEIEIFTSRPLLAELARILQRWKFADVIAASGLSIEELVLGYAELATVVEPAPIAPTIAADADDDQVLACAVAAQVDGIVSGDKHLHTLGGSYRGIRIVRAAEVLLMLEGESGTPL